MRDKARMLAAVLVLTGCLGMPFAAKAVTYEDSFSQCNYPKTFDLMVMRPISLMTIGIGAVLWVPLAPMAALTVPEDLGTVTSNLVGKPAVPFELTDHAGRSHRQADYAGRWLLLVFHRHLG